MARTLTLTDTVAVTEAALEDAFDGVAFTIAIDFTDTDPAIDVAWTDGPTPTQVLTALDAYTGIHIDQRLASQAAALFLLIEPCGQGLFDDSVLGALQPLGNFIDKRLNFNRNFIKQGVELEEIFSFHVPVGLFHMGFQIQRGGKGLIQQLNDLNAG